MHGLVIAGQWDDDALGERWTATFAPRPAPADDRPTDLTVRLTLVEAVPPAPSRPPDFEQGALLSYYLQAEAVVAHFPRFGQLRLRPGRRHHHRRNCAGGAGHLRGL